MEKCFWKIHVDNLKYIVKNERMLYLYTTDDFKYKSKNGLQGEKYMYLSIGNMVSLENGEETDIVTYGWMPYTDYGFDFYKIDHKYMGDFDKQLRKDKLKKINEQSKR